MARPSWRPALAEPRIAIIDDHELVCAGVRVLLTDAGIGEVVYAGPSTEEACRERPSVALLDIDLGPSGPPVVDGVTQLIGAGSAVLVVSAFEDRRTVQAALEAGALGFVPKRASLGVLAEAIATAALGELYMSVDLASILASASVTPDLSPRELNALQLYASGLKLTAVASRMGISPHTAKEYLDRVRAKYAAVGREARTRTELYMAASHDGLLGESVPSIGDIQP